MSCASVTCNHHNKNKLAYDKYLFYTALAKDKSKQRLMWYKQSDIMWWRTTTVIRNNIDDNALFLQFPTFLLCTMPFLRSVWEINTKLENGLRQPSVDVDATPWPAVTLTFDLWPLESNQVISRNYWIIAVSFIEIAQVVATKSA